MAWRNVESVKTTNIVISGISGVFPKSNNIEEFKKNLFSANDMISEHNRWDSLSKESGRMGIIETLDRFDHSFFGLTRKQAEMMNISERILLEKVFEAILDAGYNPNQFKGTNTGVFLAICFHDKDDSSLNEISEYSMMQILRSGTANRISYFLDIHGPSTVIDTACSSSAYALDFARKFIQNGDCEAAIVCGINLCLSQYNHRAGLKSGALSPSGRSCVFDANADGYVRSDAIVVTVLQKEKDARRIYANFIHSKTNCEGYTEEGVTYPSKKEQINLFKQFYSEINMDPQNISYIEAHGTGTRAGDKVEGSAISQFFCSKNRKIKLKIGSVKSNMGHSEACSGLCSLVKLIIAFETGFIPPNINFKTAHPDITGLHDGTMEVVTTVTPWEGEYFALNSYGLGGSNAHILISPNKKSKFTSGLSRNLPNLITVTGRTEEAVDIMLQDVVKNRDDVEYFGLLREIFSDGIIGHAYRGFVIIDEVNEPEKNIKFYPEERRPIWFIFAGMGSQWPTMGKSLLNIPIFAQSIQKSHKILETKGINLIKIITEDDSNLFKNIMNSFLGITAIQIALVDTLKEVGIEPDGIIGHSAGEVACAYADECLTAEQTLLTAYYRGLVSLDTEFVHGTMASVGERYDCIKDMIFPEIDIAAYNSSTNYTISGPTDIVKKFITELQEKNIFVREVNTSNIPYHSRYVALAGPKLISYLKKSIPEPKLRSNKWISTSVPQSEWNTNNAQYCSAEYFTNNLLNPVYFEQGSRHIPDNAITIEIAPHGLLQAILKRSLPSTVDNIPLTRKGDNDGVTFLLRALGQIHLAGRTPKLSNLYPPVAFPVSRGTPMISPLIRWQHNDLWPLPQSVKKYTTSCERSVTIDLDDSENSYLRGHIIDGRNLFPATGYLCLIWETIASMKGKRYQDVSIVFENIRFEKATNIQDKRDLSSFRWVQGSIDPYNYHSPEKRIIHVYYSGLNFRDVMISAGRISIVDTFNYSRFVEGELGLEYCGKDAIGQRYMGVTMFKALANIVETVPHLTWKVPDYMSLEDASTIPVVYATVIYAFFIKINLTRGCSVLIHAGSGGIGQAAINICLHYGCEIFTTVGTPQKVEYIRRKFPKIPESHIGNSRDTSFFKMIMNETNGKGVDVVLNSLAEEKLRASIRCVAAGGNFLEIGKFDILKNNMLELGPFIKSINFHSVHLDDTDAMSPTIKQNLRTKMQYMLDNGMINPIDITVFPITQVEEAVRYMAAGKHVGKVVIKIRDEELNRNLKPLPKRIKAQPRILCKENKSYLIIGGLGGFGLQLADWLIYRGARKIVLSSRTGLKNGYQSYKINNWKSYGVDVVISTEDVTCESGVSNLLQQANSLAPVTSIFNLAVILQDRPFNQQTEETFSISAGPKAMATIYLDKLSRQMCPQLEHFVVFSSVSCGRGNAEQTNYGMSNSIMERVCEKRRYDGLPALAVQWGAIGEVGIVADFAEDNINIVIGGTLQQNLKSCLETLNTFMLQSDPVVSSIIVAEKHHSGNNIINVVANIFGIKDLNAVSPNRKIMEMGIDSIMATELQQVIESETGISLTRQEIRKMTFGELCSLIQKKEPSQILGENRNSNPIQLALSDEFIKLPLVSIPYIRNESNNEISIDNNKVAFFFPGLEGVGPLIESLAENLPFQLLCLQYYSDDIPRTDVKAISEYFSKLITEMIGVDEEFRFIAYSLGTVIALEVANILEKQGRKGNLWLIDGSPSYVNKLLNLPSLECTILSKLMKMLLPELSQEELFKHFEEAKSREARKKCFVSLCPPDLTKESTIHKILDTMLSLRKVFSVHECNVHLLQTRCVLIRCAENLHNLDETYGLSQHCKQTIQVHEIKGVEHYTILGNKETLEIIRKNVALT